MSLMNVQQIRESMPHRYPFMLVDRVLECESGKSIHAIKNVSCNEDFFNGHFPQRPVMPGVLMVEALAQAAGLLIVHTYPSEKDYWYYFAGLDNVRFKRVVEPGDQLHLHVEVKKQRRELWVFDAKVMVDGALVCSAELLLAKGEPK
ncbi:MAG: (3R)-hydroxymyristoyl-ACP dehydratase [uncultured bacterium]|nr:MAG: (3R)-hydroxymyristoyl-ACP dehydratase [uncultured bacterium]